jgi:hypothetical protein
VVLRKVGNVSAVGGGGVGTDVVAGADDGDALGVADPWAAGGAVGPASAEVATPEWHAAAARRKNAARGGTTAF